MAGNEVRVAIVGDNSDLSRSLKDSQSKLGSFGKTITKAVVVAGAVAGAAMVKLGVDSVQAASDLNETANKARTVFGKQSGDIMRWSRDAATALGMSRQAALEGAGTFGNFFDQIGIGGKQAATMSKTWVKMAADLGSFHNTAPTEVMEALAAATRGEYDSLQKFIPTINAAAVEQQALADTGKKTAKELTNAEKAAAVYELTLKGQGKAVNDFARTSGSLANQQKILGAQWDDLKAKVGTALMPVITDFFHILNRDLMPALNKLANQYLPPVTRAMRQWAKSGGAERTISNIGDALKDIDWDDVAEGAGDIGESLRELGPALKDVSVDVIADGFTVFGTAVGFAADHVDLLKKALPYLTAAFVAYKGAQLLNNAVGKDSIAGFVIQIAHMRTMTSATRELAAATRELNMAQSGVGGNITKTGTAAQTSAGKISKLGSAAKAAGGIGGMLGLTSSMTDAASEGTSFGNVLTGTVSGALTGLAVGGPIGALIGAGAGGGLTALMGAFSGTKDEAKKTRLELLKTEGFKEATQDAQTLSEALEGVVHVYGRVTRAAVKGSFVDSEGKLDKDVAMLRAAGVSMDTIVSASMGQADAQKIVNQAFTSGLTAATEYRDVTKALWDDAKDGTMQYRDQFGNLQTQILDDESIKNYKQDYLDAQKVVDDTTASQSTFNERIGQNTGAIAEHRKEVQGLSNDLGITVRQYNQFPEAVRVKFESEGLPQTSKDAVRLIRQFKGLQNFKSIKAVISAPGVKLTGDQIKNLAKLYKLTPKQVRTLIKQEGAAKTKKDIKGVGDEVKNTKAAKPDLSPALKKVQEYTRNAKREAVKAGTEIGTGLKGGTKKARADLGPFKTSVKSGTDSAKGTAKSGGQGIGTSLSYGVISGVGSLAGSVNAAVATMVSGAIAAGRSAAQAHSPSRETERLGRDLADGLRIGVQRGSAGVADAITKLTDRTTRILDQQLKDRQKKIKDRLDGKAEAKALRRLTKTWNAHVKAVQKATADERAALIKNGRAQDALAVKLQKSKDHLADMQEFVKGIRDSMVAYGSAVGLGVIGETGDEGVDINQLLNQMRDRVAASERFADLIKSLRNQGLNKTTLDQLLAAGVEGGAATAEAIASGGASAITQINRMTSQLSATGTDLGRSMTRTFFDVGIAAQEGIVAGLIKDTAKLDRAAVTLSNNLVKAVKKALGIRSPSKVFEGIGTQVTTGLTKGLDPTAVASAGMDMASALVSAFGQPDLTAEAVYGSSGNTQITVKLTAQQVSQLERGRAVQLDLDAYHSAGGRVRS